MAALSLPVDNAKPCNNTGGRLILTIPSLRDPNTEYCIKIRSPWSKFADLLANRLTQVPEKEELHDEDCLASVFGSRSGDDASTGSLLSYHRLNHHQQKQPQQETTFSIPYDLAVCQAETNSGLNSRDSLVSLMGDELEATYHENPPMPPHRYTYKDSGELELAAIQALLARDDDTTDSDKLLLEQLLSRQATEVDDDEEEDDSTEEEEEDPEEVAMDNILKEQIKVKPSLYHSDSTTPPLEAFPPPIDTKTEDITLSLPYSPQKTIGQELMYRYRWVLADMKAQHRL